MKQLVLTIGLIGLVTACSDASSSGNSGPIPGNSDKKIFHTPAHSGEHEAGAENTHNADDMHITLDANGNAKYELGEAQTLKINDSLTIQAPANGSENAFLTEIKKNKVGAPTEGWINLYNVQFKTGTTDYASTVAQTEVNNIATILQANPSIKIKIGGYSSTDGDDQKNKELSQKRADKILADLKAKGLEKQLVKAEGYGEEHLVCDETKASKEELPTCAAQNRRVSIKIVEITH